LRRFFLKLKIPAFSTNVATAPQRRLRKGIILLAIATFILCNAWHAQAQSGVELENVTASYRYGEQITFSAHIKSSIQIQQASIVISDEANSLTQTQPLVISEDGRAEYRLDVKQNLLRPFSSVKWAYQFGLADGSTFQSGTYFIRYEDNRFDWQTLESGMLKVHWYNGDASFGDLFHSIRRQSLRLANAREQYAESPLV
jgi:hypothetical protein